MASAECAVCGTLFRSEDAFDAHRGINKKRPYGTSHGEDDERQDLGRCRTPQEMTKEGLALYQGKWGSYADVTLAAQMAKARDARGTPPNAGSNTT